MKKVLFTTRFVIERKSPANFDHLTGWEGLETYENKSNRESFWSTYKRPRILQANVH